FGREADTERTVGAGGDGGQNVWVAHHLQQQAVAVRRIFLEFLWGDDFGAVIGDRRGGDEQVAGDRGFAGGEHVPGTDYVNSRHAVRGRQVHGAGDQGHTGAGFNSCFRQREAHFSGAVVGDVAHRIDVFLSRAGGDQHVLAGQRLALETFGGTKREIVGFEHAAHADIAAGLAARGRAEHPKATAFEQLGVGLGGRIAPHGLVHGRCNGDGGVGGQYQGGQQVIGNALCQAGDKVRSGGGDQHQV